MHLAVLEPLVHYFRLKSVHGIKILIRKRINQKKIISAEKCNLSNLVKKRIFKYTYFCTPI